jgi:hypothetical protein
MIIRGGEPPPTRGILGLGTLLHFVILALVIFLPSALAKIDIFSIVPLFLLVAIESVISILVRLQDSELLKNTDPTMLFLTGLFKPIIGTTFALFVFAMLSSGLIPVTVDPAKAPYFFTALAFVSGFSERFAKDIAAWAEGTLMAVQSTKL